jgi:hypothetical protein
VLLLLHDLLQYCVYRHAVALTLVTAIPSYVALKRVSDRLEKYYKSEAVPLLLADASGEREDYSSYSFLTSALDGGECSASLLGRALSPGKGPPTPLDRRLGGPQSWSGHRLEEKSFASAGDRTPVVQSVVSAAGA